MKIRKNLDEKKCCATRCTKPPVEAHTDPGGNLLWYCQRHAAESRAGAAQFQIELVIEPLGEPAAPPETNLVVVAEEPDALPEPEVLTAEDMAAKESLSKAQNSATLAIVGLWRPDLCQARADALRQAQADTAELEGFVIEDRETEQFFETERDAVRDLAKQFEAQRTEVTKPLNGVLRAVNNLFRPVQQALQAKELAVKGLLNAKRARDQAERQRQLVAAQAAQEPEQVREALIAADTAVQEPEGTVYVDRWRFEVTDPDAVPRAFLCPDERKIAAAVKAKGGATEIPGVRVWNDPVQRRKPGR